MEKLCRAFCLSQDSSSKINKSCETIEESLQNWKLPPFSASNVYKRSSIFNSSPIETVEVEIPLSEGYTTFHLLSENLKSAYPNKFEYLHIGMIQVGLKPTKLGSNTSAVISLRGKTSKSFHESLIGMVESSLCDGPIYFSYFPNSDNSRYISLYEDLSSALCIDIKTEGVENTILMYRLHYRVIRKYRSKTRYLSRYCVDKKGETTLFLTNVAQSNRVLSKKICWDEVAVPVKWMEWREYAEAHLLQVDVPGFEKEEVQVRVETGGIVRITGERSRPEQAAFKGGLILRRVMVPKNEVKVLMRNGVFLRRLRVPENAKLEEVKAVMENGVLTVVVPKEEINEELKEKVVNIMG